MLVLRTAQSLPQRWCGLHREEVDQGASSRTHQLAQRRNQGLRGCLLFARRSWSWSDSINADGAASHAHTLPKVEWRPPKNIPEWSQKLQGVLVHGKAISLFNIFHGIKSWANMMLTTLLRTLQIMDLRLAGTVHLKVGGSENWNSTVLLVLDLLFDTYPELKEVVISRFGAGHTHADLDRIYGYLNRVLFGVSPGGHRAGRNILSREVGPDPRAGPPNL